MELLVDAGITVELVVLGDVAVAFPFFPAFGRRFDDFGVYGNTVDVVVDDVSSSLSGGLSSILDNLPVANAFY